jgi:hypothetical protein
MMMFSPCGIKKRRLVFKYPSSPFLLGTTGFIGKNNQKFTVTCDTVPHIIGNSEI